MTPVRIRIFKVFANLPVRHPGLNEQAELQIFPYLVVQRIINAYIQDRLCRDAIFFWQPMQLAHALHCHMVKEVFGVRPVKTQRKRAPVDRGEALMLFKEVRLRL